MPHPIPTEEKSPRFVEVALPVPLQKLFTYRIPPGLAEVMHPGARVLVPFGKQTLTGYISNFRNELDSNSEFTEDEVKDIVELQDEEPLVTEEILALTKWAAEYYAASWGEMLKASLPAGINTATERIVSITEAGRDELSKKGDSIAAKWAFLQLIADNGELTEREIIKVLGNTSRYRISKLARSGLVAVRDRTVATKVKAKLRKAVRLLKIIDESAETKPLTGQQQAVVDTLKNAGGEMLFTDLLGRARVGASPVTTLAKRGFLEITVQEVRRDPLSKNEAGEYPSLKLTTEQKRALSEIEGAIITGKYNAFLLHGVTGSGKTEVYIRAMRSAMARGKTALMLVPEIALTPVFSRRLQVIFGSDVAILHSNLSPGERFDEWRRIRSGDARVVIGTRSAVFAPLENLGLVIVDEEHDGSYRQNESPFYHARDVAVVRANRADAVIVLGSATPALETFHNAHTGKYKYLQLQSRIGGRPLARAELIDMREVFKRAGKDVVLSPQLIAAIEETHARGEQTMILINRRGFSSFVLCRLCGETLRCKNCDITLTYHRSEAHLICHYCNYTVKTPKECPFCESEFLYFMGHGTEQVEDLLRKRFPNFNIARIDRDTMARKGEMAKTLYAFDKGEIDMLVGTQMIAKGHDFHNVTLVGVISVDTMLGMPDLRSAERTFQLLTQVAGRAGRGSLPGRVLIQTYYPEHYALRHAVGQDFDGFYTEEMRYRERLGYPPYFVLASIMFVHGDLNYASKSASIFRDSLDRANKDSSLRILGPAQASVARIKNKYRQQIIVKSQNRRSLREMIDNALDEAETRGCDRRIMNVEIDPVNLM
jgi:primosomal protein N' (replication factor Y)